MVLRFRGDGEDREVEAALQLTFTEYVLFLLHSSHKTRRVLLLYGEVMHVEKSYNLLQVPFAAQTITTRQ